MSDSLRPQRKACQASLSITISRSSLKLMSIKSVMPSSHLILYRPFLLLPPIPPSIRVFSNESTLLMRWPKYWSFSFSIIPSKEIPGLISFRMDWLDLLAVQGTLKSLLQHHSSWKMEEKKEQMSWNKRKPSIDMVCFKDTQTGSLPPNISLRWCYSAWKPSILKWCMCVCVCVWCKIHIT